MRERIEKYLSDLEAQILNADKCRIIQMKKEWVKLFPLEAGVIVIREEGIICFVEETSNLQNSVLNLFDTRNHAVRKRIAETHFKNEIEYHKTNTIIRYSDEMEQELNNILEDNFEISTLVVLLGRKELAERIVDKYKPIYNSEIPNKIIENNDFIEAKSDSSLKVYSVDEIRKKHGNAYMPWTPQADAELWRLKELGRTIPELAAHFGRNNGSITSRLTKIEFSMKN